MRYFSLKTSSASTKPRGIYTVKYTSFSRGRAKPLMVKRTL